MKLTESLLPKLNEWSPAGAGRHSWAAAFPSEGWTVQIAVDKVDSIGSLVWELALSRTGEPPAGLTIKGWAAAIAERVSGLLEPLKVYEVDETRGEALLRSNEPARKGEALAYYEVKLAGVTSATVRRFTAARNQGERTQVSFAITHEVLAKLAGDIAG